MMPPEIVWKWGASDLRQAVARMGLAESVILDAVETAMNDIAPDLQREILSKTPAPQVQEVPRTWKRTGQLARSIRVVVTRRGKTIKLTANANVPYDRWIELGVRNTAHGVVTMRVRPGGYRMFEHGRTWLSSPAMNGPLSRAIRPAAAMVFTGNG